MHNAAPGFCRGPRYATKLTINSPNIIYPATFATLLIPGQLLVMTGQLSLFCSTNGKQH